MVLCNLMMLRSWHHETGLGDPNHPLLTEHTPDEVPAVEPVTRTIEITDEEYALIQRARLNVA